MTTNLREELEAELKADDRRAMPQSTCKTCAWLRSLSQDERDAWQDLIADDSITMGQLERAIIVRRKAGMGESALRSHRTKGHRA